MPESPVNRAHRTIEHLRSGGTALTVSRMLLTTTPSKWISEARMLAGRLGLTWVESWVQINDGRRIKLYRVAA